MSKKARGGLGDIVYSSWKGIPYARSKGDYHDANSKKQRPLRAKFKAAVRAWRKLTAAEKSAYNKRAEMLAMSGYNLFIKEFMGTANN